jgi:midasin (ATPase involved in ribosome maturation)
VNCWNTLRAYNKIGQSAAKFNSNIKKVHRLVYGVLKRMVKYHECGAFENSNEDIVGTIGKLIEIKNKQLYDNIIGIK